MTSLKEFSKAAEKGPGQCCKPILGESRMCPLDLHPLSLKKKSG